MAKLRIGEILLKRQVITEEQLKIALEYQNKWGHRLGISLVMNGFISEGDLLRVLSQELQIPTVDLAREEIDETLINAVPVSICTENLVFPIRIDTSKHQLILAVVDPQNLAVIDEVSFITGYAVKPVLAQISSINSAINKYYKGLQVEIVPNDYSDQGDVSDEKILIPGLPRDDEPAEDENETAMANVAHDFPLPVIPAIQQATYDSFSDQSTPLSGSTPSDALEKLETKFWAMMRVLVKKGLLTKDEYLKELGKSYRQMMLKKGQ